MIMLDKKLSLSYLAKLFCYWYQDQIYVQWGCPIPRGFNVTNGVRQGGVLPLNYLTSTSMSRVLF